MSLDTVNMAISFEHIFHPLGIKDPAINYYKNSIEKKIIGLVIFIFSTIITAGIIGAFFIVTAHYKKNLFNKMNNQRIFIASSHLEALEKLEHDFFDKNQDLREVIKKIRMFLKNDLKVTFPRDNHALHDYLTQFTDRIKDDSKLCIVWEKFLVSMHQLKIRYPYGSAIFLDITPELKRLSTNNQASIINIELLDVKNKSDVQQISQIYYEAFGGIPTLFLSKDFNKSNKLIVIARDSITKQIEGCVWISKKRKSTKTYVYHVVRRANAAKRGIISELFRTLKQKHFTDSRVSLDVSVNNFPAIEAYKKFGFSPKKLKKNLYKFPPENALKMSYNTTGVAS